jgi:hypothetical protein
LLVLDVHVEERLANDRQRQPHHLLRDVSLSQSPLLPRAIGVLPSSGRSRRCVAMKRGLHQAALAQVHRTLAGQQAVAEQPLVRSRPRLLVMRFCVTRSPDLLDR